MIALLLACAAPLPSETGQVDSTPDSADSADSAAGAETGDTAGWISQPLISPAEAEDLDPDPDVLSVVLVAAPATHSFVYEGETYTVEGYAYNGQLPGPTLRAHKGDTVQIELDNELDEATTIHWHGLAVPHEMDGHTWMMDPVQPGESFVYTFTLDTAGTYWYHPHFNSSSQVDLGLYGVFIVEDDAEPAPDDELVAVLDDWEIAGFGPAEGEDTDAHGASGREGLWTVNGLVQPTLDLAGITRARVVNVSNVGYIDLAWTGLRQIGSDQGLLPALDTPADLLLAPGDRADLELLPVDGGFVAEDLGYTHHGSSSWQSPATLFTVDSDATVTDGLDWPFLGTAVSEDPGRTDLVYTFSGDGDQWFINGEQYPDITPQTLDLGDAVVIEVRNLSPTEHPFHVHGLRFELLSVNGVAPDYYTLEDTLNVGVYDTLRLLLHADNPGDWMLHCHILPHADQGMMTILSVLAP